MLQSRKMERGVFEIVDTESLVPANHLLRKIDAAVNYGKIYDMVEPLYCADNNLSVPNDLSIVGFDDIFFAEVIQPPLTTIAQPITEIAEAVVEKLVSQIEHPTQEISAVPQMFTPVLKVRGSVRRIDVNSNKANNGGSQ